MRSLWVLVSLILASSLAACWMVFSNLLIVMWFPQTLPNFLLPWSWQLLYKQNIFEYRYAIKYKVNKWIISKSFQFLTYVEYMDTNEMISHNSVCLYLQLSWLTIFLINAIWIVMILCRVYHNTCFPCGVVIFGGFFIYMTTDNMIPTGFNVQF